MQDEAVSERQSLPIDIYYNKLLEWLIDRRHCQPKWQDSALVIREKINEAIQDMPAVDEIMQLLSGSYINYFHCVRIVELLKVSESATKNIFGRYSSKRMKDWLEILQLYETDNLGLAEASHMLIRNVNYEIPSLKRQIAKDQQTQRDCTRKESEYALNANNFKEKYHHVCKQMGIKGTDIREELLLLLNDLPMLYDDVCGKTTRLNDILHFYVAFVDFISPRKDESARKNKDLCPVICHIMEHGNTSVYQWRTGNIPTLIINPDQENETTDNTESSEINWDITDDTSKGEENGAIDFGENIDFGDNIESIDYGDNIDFGDNIDYGNGDGQAIDFGDSISNEIKIEDSGDDGIAQGTDALTMLAYPQTRNSYIDEVLELQAFLDQRLKEMEDDTNILSSNQFQSSRDILQRQSRESVQAMKDQIDDIVNVLTSVKIQNLFLIKASPRYVDRLTESLQHKLKLSEKMQASCKVLAERKREAAAHQSELEPKLDVIVTKTKQLQQQISEEISKKYDNRIVNIMGEVNSI
ncbi:CDK5 regulatory subunit-associated protein 3-like [Dendronephthya gigantea]|uniref:CDK5 regulatory subunit-associated protein 3-like n=1 Tax=Dendronephthya gigantea TaxID=151771 RepID=UPI00106B08E0|nr:CDK5 regulatory subunit-associated protein 3-like [Dendronephthya gigantea]